MIRAIITEYAGSRMLALKREAPGSSFMPDLTGRSEAALSENRREVTGFISFKLYTGKNREGFIYNGRVDKRVPNIDSCFVRLSREERGYLDTAGIKPETTLPVMVKKEGKGSKKAVVSTELSISGRYCVLIYRGKGAKGSGKNDILFSHKLAPSKRKELALKLKEKGYDQNRYSLIFRTNAGLVDFGEVCKELESMKRKMDGIIDYCDKRTDYSVLYDPGDELIRDLYNIELDELSEVITDIMDVYEIVREGFMEGLAADFKEKIRLTYYEDELVSLKSLVGMESGIQQATDKKVWLKSGSYLVIEQTEALVSIDVNSGKNEAKGMKDETVCRINREAAVEAARQLRLRNLSGIIIVDFINMKSKKHEEELLELFRDEIRKDSVRTELVDMTRLGLAELTRKREGLSLNEMLYMNKLNKQ